ncbi:SLAM family member 7 [Misgurnus anguillicaudatus]|uniref:SLAM family member 7 n=1 Tax=Misgurnus anguillicaudatus TaxID=75329 RepID=UPI003CCF45E1
MALAVIIFTALLVTNKVFSIENSVFVKTGGSIQLETRTQEIPDYYELIWKFGETKNIVTYKDGEIKCTVHNSYKNRVQFDTETYSLTLMNMQKTDSGVYTLIASGTEDIAVCTYNISVMDGVDAPDLTVISNWSSSDSCTVNFTCRAHNLTLHSTYDNNSCSVGVDSLEIFTLILNCTEDSIICNHSNPVSWKIETQEVKQLCPQYYKNHKQQTGSFKIPWFVYPCILGALLIFGLVYLFFRNKNKGLKQLDNTIYAEVESRQMQSGKKECHVYELPEMMCPTVQRGNNKPQTTYSTVGQHRKPHKKTRKPSQDVPTDNILSIYSVVSKLPDV